MFKLLISFVSILIITACQQEAVTTTIPRINKMHIEPTEPQAITNDGLVVAAEDLNLGNLILFWSSNYPADEKFRYYLYVNKSPDITNYDDFVVTHLCNIRFIECSPQKQTRCQIDNDLFYCLADTRRGFRLDSVIDKDKTEQNMWITLRVCPFKAMADDENCAQESRQFILAKTCSKYRYSPCLDQDPLQVSNFELRNIQSYENDLPVLDNSKIGHTDFYPTWQSSWITEPYNFRIDLVDSREPNNRVTLLQSSCNDRIKCNGSAQVQCSLYPNESGASITCLGNPKTFQIKELDERHPAEDIDLIFELTAKDGMFQQETILSTSAILKK